MHAVVEEIAGNEQHVHARARAQPEEIVGRVGDVGKAAERSERIRAEERRRRAQLKQSAAEVLALVRQARRQEHRRRPAGPGVRRRQRERRGRLAAQRFQHHRKAVRVHDIVGVVVLQELPARERSRAAPIPVIADVLGIHRHANARVAPRVFVRNGNRRVRRSIVADDQLEVAERLREHAVDGFRDVRLAVVGRHQHADRRRRSAHRAARSVERTRRTTAFGIHGRSRRLP